MCVYTFLCSIVAAPPTAELEPLTDGQVSQTDEVSDDLDRDYKIAKICFFSQPSVQKPNTLHWLSLSWRIMKKSGKPVRSWNNKCLTYLIHFHHSLQSLSIDQLIHSFLPCLFSFVKILKWLYMPKTIFPHFFHLLPTTTTPLSSGRHGDDLFWVICDWTTEEDL